MTTVVVLATDRADPVGELLLARATAWVRAALPQTQMVMADPGHGLVEVLSRAREVSRENPLIVVCPVLPVWPAELAHAMRSDLDDGCALAVGPIFDGGFYLLALARAIPGLTELSPDELSGRHAMNTLIELAARDGSEVGLLRTHRGLRCPTDVRALLADPLTDPELRALLS